MSPEAEAQVQRAAAWGQDAGLLPSGGAAAIVTHGVMHRLLARGLVRQGWRFGAGLRGFDY